MEQQYNWVDNDIIVTFEGTLRFEAIFEINSKIYGDSRFDKMRFQIADFSNVDNYVIDSFSPETVAIILTNLDKNAMFWNTDVKVALVLSQNTKWNEYIEMYNQAMQETNWDSKTFKSKEEALEWVEK